MVEPSRDLGLEERGCCSKLAKWEAAITSPGEGTGCWACWTGSFSTSGAPRSVLLALLALSALRWLASTRRLLSWDLRSLWAVPSQSVSVVPSRSSSVEAGAIRLLALLLLLLGPCVRSRARACLLEDGRLLCSCSAAFLRLLLLLLEPGALEPRISSFLRLLELLLWEWWSWW